MKCMYCQKDIDDSYVAYGVVFCETCEAPSWKGKNCPKCNSEAVEISALFRTRIFWYCQSCKHRWQERS